MTYQVLARRLRPQRFADVVGQDHVTRTLQAAIAAGRVAHAFLFTGPRGVGKTTTARLLAKALNCEQGPTPEPCNACSNCKEIGEGTAVDVLEIAGASHTQVDKMRDLMEPVAHLPLKSRFKIFIIDEVHMLSSHSFNALLKTLEEPPAHVKFIFATTEPHKVLATVISRCQRYDLRRIGLGELRAHLRRTADAEGLALSDEALALVAREGGRTCGGRRGPPAPRRPDAAGPTPCSGFSAPSSRRTGRSRRPRAASTRSWSSRCARGGSRRCRRSCRWTTSSAAWRPWAGGTPPPPARHPPAPSASAHPRRPGATRGGGSSPAD